MSSIHYKFRSNLEYNTITFDSQAVSLNDLRDAIMLQKKIAKSPDYTLEITNAQTKEGKKHFRNLEVLLASYKNSYPFFSPISKSLTMI